jgi:hypothetical protein
MSKYKISGYTYTRNAVEMEYPFEECIRSMLGFCDQVVVVDSSDGNDSTLDRLKVLAKQNSKLEIYQADIDWTEPNHAIYDGQLKALARQYCTGDYLVQADVDEIFEENCRSKFEFAIELCKGLNDPPLLALPVVEYWGDDFNKVRVDVNPWKWRISKNLPDITHGIPAHLRKVENGLLYSRPGSDGCNYIFESTGLEVPCKHFVNMEVEKCRQQALTDSAKLKEYQAWFNEAVSSLPTVYHFSWFSIPRKIRQYRLFWTTFWKSMYNLERDNKNPFFDVDWDKVTDEMIETRGKELATKTGGWIFHQPWDGSSVNSVSLNGKPPKIIKEWCQKNTDKILTDEMFSIGGKNG